MKTENIVPTIMKSPERKLIGQRVSMSFAENKTFQLWNGFMLRRKEIENAASHDLISMQVYDSSFSFMNFDATKKFDKWAAIEVPDFSEVPHGMETFTLEEGMYAVFHYKGLSTDTSIFQYILGVWLPGSQYQLDSRPHFEVLGEKYKNNDPDSEEEIWIPVKLKKINDIKTAIL